MSVVPLIDPSLLDSETVRCYVRGELDAARQAQFEQALLGSVQLQDDVEAELLLEDCAKEIEVPGAFAGLRAHLPKLALAACLLLAFVGGYGLKSALSDHAHQVPAGALAHVSFTHLRGSEARRFEVASGVPLSARFLTAEDLPHQIKLRDARSALRLSLTDLLPDADGNLYVLLPAFAHTDAPLLIELSSANRRDTFQLHVLR